MSVELTYGVAIIVTKNVQVPGALMPAIGVKGKIINASRELIVCEFQTPYPLAGGGAALYDENHPRGNRVYFKKDEIEVTT